MSLKDRLGISKILNRTNYRLLAWYFGPEKSKQSGLKHFRLVHQEPMQSTGKEKFTVYVYAKTRLYKQEDKEAWETDPEDEAVSEVDEKASSDPIAAAPEEESENDEEEDEEESSEDNPAKPTTSTEDKPRRGRPPKKRRGRPAAAAATSSVKDL